MHERKIVWKDKIVKETGPRDDQPEIETTSLERKKNKKQN